MMNEEEPGSSAPATAETTSFPEKTTTALAKEEPLMSDVSSEAFSGPEDGECESEKEEIKKPVKPSGLVDNASPIDEDEIDDLDLDKVEEKKPEGDHLNVATEPISSPDSPAFNREIPGPFSSLIHVNRFLFFFCCLPSSFFLMMS